MDQNQTRFNDTLPCRRCRDMQAGDPCVYDVDRGSCAQCETTGQLCDVRGDDFRVERHIIRRLIRTQNQLRRARARIIQRPGMNGTSLLTDVLLRRIQAEIRRLEERVFDLRGDDLIEMSEA
ncbi:hypothetical protein PGT21_000832 [Puccinia graminis f. sp. tritici]|uniref:Uncharacterized protein n=1 Tax=Puccinia graminis f. sp. tritici TaxID=56615 RepID=A0A5B0NN65_PUCGR|nr:hypothetical protein PGT21_000832 [Puccinia graminis f. sp. tritici]KAA1090243.1 hypothetical protein PGTUg99_037517 [Puccinia graminis f. sp. tritici]